MEWIFKNLTGIMAVLTPTEAVSLLLIIVGIMVITAKYTITAANYFKQPKGGPVSTENPSEVAISIQHLIATLKNISTLLTSVEAEAAKNSTTSTLINHQLSEIHERLQEITVEFSLKQLTAVELATKTLAVLELMKHAFSIHDEANTANAIENRSLHHTALEHINEISKDVAQLQGTLLGSISGRTAMK